ncbi:unnamed protein product, partial [Strongylus vulgaris]
MDRHPIRYFVDVHHSGSSHISRVKRIRHPGKEEIGPPVLSSYTFSKTFATPGPAPVQRLEPQRELPNYNIREYSSMYHHGSSHEDDTPHVRLIARVYPDSMQMRGSASRSLDGSLFRENGSLSREDVSPRRDVAMGSLEPSSSQKRVHEDSPATAKFQTATTKKMKKDEQKDDSGTSKDPKEALEGRSLVATSSTVTTTTRVTNEKQGSWQTKEVKEAHSSTSKGTGGYSTKESKSVKHDAPADTSGRTYLSGRSRHEGEEQTVEKERVKPESYGLPSTSFGGPLQTTTRRSDLEPTPLREYARAYHSGQSWNDTKPIPAARKGEGERANIKRTEHISETGEGDRAGAKKDDSPVKTAVVKKRSSPMSDEEEERKIRLIARVTPHEEEEEQDSKKPKKDKDSSGLFSFWKGGKRKKYEVTTERSTDEKLASPQSTISRQKDVEKLPLKAPAPVPYKPSKDTTDTSRHAHLFGRQRHEGEEETVEKDRARPQSYGLPSTSEGPLERTAPESELKPAPLKEYAQAYHHGESWNEGKKTTSSSVQPVASERTKKKAVLHLKTSPKKEHSSELNEEDEGKVRLIAHVPYSPEKEELDLSKLRETQDQSGSFNLSKSREDEQEHRAKKPFTPETETTRRTYLFGR